MLLEKAQVQEHIEQLGALSDAEQMLHDRIKENTEAYNSMKTERKDLITSANEEALVNETLWSKLQSVVDQNGKVLAGKRSICGIYSGRIV